MYVIISTTNNSLLLPFFFSSIEDAEIEAEKHFFTGVWRTFKIKEFVNVKLKTLEIFHPESGKINYDLKKGKYKYEKITQVKCKNINQVFKMCQNDFSKQYASLEKRSTCVGDIIVDKERNQAYFIDNTSYLPIPIVESYT